MTAVAQTLAACRAQGRAALIGYLPVGYPDLAGSVDAMRAMVEAGSTSSRSASPTRTRSWTAR